MRQDKSYKLAQKESGKENGNKGWRKKKAEPSGLGTWEAIVLSLNVCD